MYKHTGMDKYVVGVHKKALNAAANELKKSKRNIEYYLTKQNIELDSKSLYTYAKSKQNVRDKVRPLGDNAGDIITQRFLMASN